jgi:hypothetical protein
MTKFQFKSVQVIRNLDLDIVWDLACLREAPPAKALCGGQALRRRQVFVIWCFDRNHLLP